MGLLGNRLLPPPAPHQAPLSLPVPANPLLAPQLYGAFFPLKAVNIGWVESQGSFRTEIQQEV